MSDVDIPKGSHWPKTLGEQLAETEAGVICVTRENQEEPWLLFEAGSLAKTFKDQSRLCVFLLGLQPVDLKPGPLTFYQATRAEEEDTWKLILSLNDLGGDAKLEKDRLRRSYERAWPDFKAKLNNVSKSEPLFAFVDRNDRELLEEILSGVRNLMRNINTDGVSLQAPKYVAPRTPEEEIIQGLWQQTLGVEKIGIYEDFFALGGTSLSFVHLHALLQHQFAIDFKLVDLFQSCTIAEQARLVRNR